MEKVYIQQWDQEKFFNARDEWHDLLERSDADPLFLSWEWQSNWWRFFSDEKMQLQLFIATTEDKKLVGIAPLFSTTTTIKSALQTTRLQFIGNCWRGKATMPTELLDFITDKSISKEVTLALCNHLNTLTNWDELILPFLHTKSRTYKLIHELKLFSKAYLRHAETFHSYYLETSGDFQSYLSALGKNTRLKLFNRRKNLQRLGEVNYQRMPSNNIDELFTLLNELHEKRWGQAIFKNQRLEFNKALANQMAEKGRLNFSLITLDGDPISIQYNYLIHQHNYNIQAGFDEKLNRKISLGYLHFGYEIEEDFKQRNKAYDFLAGEGKNTQYKKHLTRCCLPMTDLQIIRHPLLKILYKSYDRFKLKSA